MVVHLKTYPLFLSLFCLIVFVFYKAGSQICLSIRFKTSIIIIIIIIIILIIIIFIIEKLMIIIQNVDNFLLLLWEIVLHLQVQDFLTESNLIYLIAEN